MTDKGEKIGAGFRTYSGFDNYIRIVTDPRIQGPFFKIFLWTVAFSGISVVTTFAVGMLLAVILEWKELRFRRAYRTLLILPYAVPAVLSILIFKGLFSQEFGAVNEFLRAVFGFAPEWETNPWGARAMILLVNVWLGYPYMMLVCTGMLQSIPSAIYEASAIDGSGPVVDFFDLTLPLVLPPLMPILISSFAFNFNNFQFDLPPHGRGPENGRRWNRRRNGFARELHFQHCLPGFRDKLWSGQRDRHPAFHHRRLSCLDQSETERAKRQNVASIETLDYFGAMGRSLQDAVPSVTQEKAHDRYSKT